MKNSEKKIEKKISEGKITSKRTLSITELNSLVKNIQIIHEDENLLVINKPSGIYTIPDRFDVNLPNIYSIFNQKYGKIFIVHRLDRDTSGILLLAKNAETHKYLNDLFAEQGIIKMYHAVTYGVIPENEFDIDIPITTSPSKKGMSIPSSRGKVSLTKIKVVQRFKFCTLVEADLVTGRHHQLRVHLYSIEHPLYIDELYGSPVPFYLSTIKTKFNLKKHTDEQPVISRITMHAFSLEFIHPTTNLKVKYEASYPKDFEIFLKLLNKYSKSKF